MFGTQTKCNVNTVEKISKNFDLTENYIEDLEKGFRLVVVESSFDKVVFEMSGIDIAIANTLRRILISEVPTMAIEKVFFMTNTSVMDDEILAHRLGLIPIQVNPDYFETKKDEDAYTDLNTIVLNLQIKCPTLDKLPLVDGLRPDYLSVYSSDLKIDAQGQQVALFNQIPIKLAHDNILLLKLVPGQEIDLECHAVKGIGSTHAKWSPVSTAYYTMLTDIQFIGDIPKGDEAIRLKNTCPMKVFDIEDSGQIFVKDKRKCTVCRECLRDNFNDRISITRISDHVIFTIESSGQIPAYELLPRALNVLNEKVAYWRNEAASYKLKT